MSNFGPKRDVIELVVEKERREKKKARRNLGIRLFCMHALDRSPTRNYGTRRNGFSLSPSPLNFQFLPAFFCMVFSLVFGSSWYALRFASLRFVSLISPFYIR